MTKHIIVIGTLILLYSCSQEITKSRGECRTINNTFKESLYITPVKVKGRNYIEGNLLELFEVSSSYSKEAELFFDIDDRLILTYTDSIKSNTLVFEGRFRNNNIYEVFLRNTRKEIPPLVPIFYGYRDVYRIRIICVEDDMLIIENKWVRDGNIFLFAAGGGGRAKYYFKIKGKK